MSPVCGASMKAAPAGGASRAKNNACPHAFNSCGCTLEGQMFRTTDADITEATRLVEEHRGRSKGTQDARRKKNLYLQGVAYQCLDKKVGRMYSDQAGQCGVAQQWQSWSLRECGTAGQCGTAEAELDLSLSRM
eukprot:1158636-Pelagomonas_calceolata.AAC.2